MLLRLVVKSDLPVICAQHQKSNLSLSSKMLFSRIQQLIVDQSPHKYSILLFVTKQKNIKNQKQKTNKKILQKNRSWNLFWSENSCKCEITCLFLPCQSHELMWNRKNVLESGNPISICWFCNNLIVSPSEKHFRSFGFQTIRSSKSQENWLFRSVFVCMFVFLFLVDSHLIRMLKAKVDIFNKRLSHQKWEKNKMNANIPNHAKKRNNWDSDL